MEHEYLIIEEQGEDLVVTGLKDNAPSDIVIPEGVTKIEKGGISGIYNQPQMLDKKKKEKLNKINSVSVPDSVTEIGDFAFAGCEMIKFIIMSKNLRKIGSNAFSRCSGQTSISIPEGVTEIGSWAFHNFVGLMSILLPKSLRNIGMDAFSGCSNLTSIIVPENVSNLEASTFENCKKLTSIQLHDGIKAIYSRVFEGCSSLISIDIPSKVTVIPEDAFYGCSSLTHVGIHDDITAIYGRAFGGCTSLKTIYMPNRLQMIGLSAFRDCPNLETIRKPIYSENGARLLYVPKDLTEFVVPNGVKTIDSNAFFGCNALVSVSIPEGVTEIEGQTFNGFGQDFSLTTVNLPDSISSIGNRAFKCTPISSIKLPRKLKTIDYQTFLGCYKLTKIEIPEGVTKIEESAFECCSSLTSVIIPDSVTEIGENAFSDCNKLTDVSIPSHLAPRDIRSAFSGCKSLKFTIRDVDSNEATDEPVNYYKGKSITPHELLRELMSFIRKKSCEDKNNFNYAAELICISGKVSELSDMMKNRNDGFFEFMQGSEDLATNERFFDDFWRNKKDSLDDTDMFLVIENADLVCKSYMEDEMEFTRSLSGIMHSMKSINGMSSNMYKSGWHVILLMDDRGDKSWCNSDFCEYFSQKGLYRGYYIEG